MRYNVYKLVHLLGVMTLFMGLAGLLWMHLAGVKDDRRARRLGAIFHGVGLVMLLVSGFGLLALLTAGSPTKFPAWVIVKMVLWLVLGGAIALIGRVRPAGWPLPLLFLLLGGASAYLGVFKPF